MRRNDEENMCRCNTLFDVTLFLTDISFFNRHSRAGGNPMKQTIYYYYQIISTNY